MPDENSELDEAKTEEEEPGVTVVHEHIDPGASSGVSSGALVTGGGGFFTPTPTPDEGPTTSSGLGVDFPAHVEPLGEEIKKHAACDSAHLGQLGWQGPTRKGADAQTLAQQDADDHNTRNPGHLAAVLDGVGT